MVADEKRILAAAHRPAARARIAVAAHDRVHHLAVDRAHRRAGDGQAAGHRTGLVNEPPGLSQIGQLRRALDEAQQADEIGGVDQIAEAGEGGINHLAALRGQAVGVVFDADPPPATAEIRHQVAQFTRRVRPFAVGSVRNLFLISACLSARRIAPVINRQPSSDPSRKWEGGGNMVLVYAIDAAISYSGCIRGSRNRRKKRARRTGTEL